MDYLLIFAVAAAITFLITPTIRYFALKFSVIDRKGRRKIHDRVVTRFGGLAIYIGFVFAMLTVFFAGPGLEQAEIASFKVIFIAATLMLFLGIYDDVRGANCQVKFSVQLLAALLLIRSGFIMRIVDNSAGSVPFGLGVLLTVLWLVGITNAINLIDGLDGLAAGIVLISSIGLFFVFLFSGRIMPAFFAAALGGACLGFLRYNFFPAKVFMGDTGSIFLGFSIASLAILANHDVTPAVVLLVPIVGLGVPIVDTSMAFFRRIIRKKNPFQADQEHIHHRLLKLNFSKKQVVFILWTITAFLNIFAYIIFSFR